VLLDVVVAVGGRDAEGGAERGLVERLAHVDGGVVARRPGPLRAGALVDVGEGLVLGAVVLVVVDERARGVEVAVAGPDDAGLGEVGEARATEGADGLDGPGDLAGVQVAVAEVEGDAGRLRAGPDVVGGGGQVARRAGVVVGALGVAAQGRRVVREALVAGERADEGRALVEGGVDVAHAVEEVVPRVEAGGLAAVAERGLGRARLGRALAGLEVEGGHGRVVGGGDVAHAGLLAVGQHDEDRILLGPAGDQGPALELVVGVGRDDVGDRRLGRGRRGGTGGRGRRREGGGEEGQGDEQPAQTGHGG
jgi:hypothetical protein